MSNQLLHSLNNNNDGYLKSFLNSFESGEVINIAWYPSAGWDFRALLYLSKQYEDQNPSGHKTLRAPHIFIFTDYNMRNDVGQNDSDILYSDDKTTISVVAKEELPKLDLPLHKEIVDFPDDHPNLGRVTYMEVDVESDELGQFQVPIIYIHAENEAFAAEFLLLNNTKLSHIIHVRYVGGCGGGGKARGSWIPAMLDRFGTEIFITDNRHEVGIGDRSAIEIYPQLDGDCDISNLVELRRIDAEKWSNYGDVSWYEVKQ